MPSVELIPLLDATLPQTQCGLCGHPAGCLPYATAMAEGASADGCVPGGQPVADELARILGRDRLPAKPSQWPIATDGRPERMKAIIREDECIGCTKCITACPVDAIIGSGKMMHTILTDLCTGCELCIPPCPVDCIDLVPDTQPLLSNEQRLLEQNDLRQRYQQHIIREQQIALTQKTSKPTVAATISTEQAAAITGIAIEHVIEQSPPSQPIKTNPQITIKLAGIRSQIKKLQRQLATKPDVEKSKLLESLESELKQFTEST